MKNTLHFLCLLLWVLSAQSQNFAKGSWQWSKKFGAWSGNDPQTFEVTNDIKVDKDGYVYSCGISHNWFNYDTAGQRVTFIFDPRPGITQLHVGTYLAKHDCRGNLVYMVKMNGIYGIGGMEFDEKGNIMLLGEGGGGVDITTPYGYTHTTVDGIVSIRFDKYGKLLGVKAVSNNYSFLRMGAKKVLHYSKRKNLFYYVGLVFPSTTPFPNGQQFAHTCYFVASIDTAGNLVWAKEVVRVENNVSVTDFDVGESGFLVAGNMKANPIIFLGGSVTDTSTLGIDNGRKYLLVLNDTLGYRWHAISTSHDFTYIERSFFYHNNPVVIGGGDNNTDIFGLKIVAYGGIVPETFAFIGFHSDTPAVSFSNMAEGYGLIDLDDKLRLSTDSTHLMSFAFIGRINLNSLQINVTDPNLIQPDLIVLKSFGGANSFQFTDFFLTANKRTQTQPPFTSAYSTSTTDQQGNLYLSGKLSGSIYFGTDTLTTYGGTGKSDGFIAKWGLPCSDSSALIRPLAPDSLRATANQNVIELRWRDFAKYEDRFNIYRATDSAGPYVLLDTTGRNITAYTDATAQPSVIYWYKVRAANSEGESKSTNIDSAIILPSAIQVVRQQLAQMELYPNPTSTGRVTLSIVARQAQPNAILSVFDISGRTLHSETIELQQGRQETELNLQKLPQGIYWIRLQARHESITEKLVVVR